MKTLSLVLTLILFSFTSYSANDEAIQYNDKIVEEQSKVAEKILDFSANPNESTLSEIKQQAASGLDVLKKMKAFDKNKSFLEAAKSLFEFYYSITENEYKQSLDLLSKLTPENQAETVTKLNKLLAVITDKEKILDEKFKEEQQKFADKYGFNLVENKFQDKVDELKNSDK